MKKLPILSAVLAVLLLFIASSTASVSADTSIVITNSANGRNSTNIGSVALSGGTCVAQKNKLKVKNRIRQKAKTGSNQIQDNINGSVHVNTGSVTETAQTTTTGGSNYTAIDYCGGGGGCACCRQCKWVTSWEHKSNFVKEATQGTKKDDSPITDPQRIDPATINGAPDDNFYSLGKGGSVLFKFKGKVSDHSGVDIKLTEVTWGRDSYPEETALIEVSKNGVNWYVLGTASNKDSDGISEFDLSVLGLNWIRYIRVSDTTNYDPHNDQADGYDLDAIMVTYKVCK